jgi:hypothetical protein
MNYVPVLGYNSSRFDMNFLNKILHDWPNHYVESIIGNLIYFKQVTVRTGDGVCLKFLDVMNYPPPQTLESFLKYYNINDVMIILSLIHNFIDILFKWWWICCYSVDEV